MNRTSDTDGPGTLRSAGSGRRHALLALAACSALVLGACSSPAQEKKSSAPVDPDAWVVDTPQAKSARDAVTWNLLLEPAKIDPAESNNYGESTVVSNLCESLQKQNPDFSISDGLASVKASADGLTLVYTINPDATFWDGKPVTADDVAFSLTRAWKPKGSPYWTAYYAHVQSIEATGDRQVTVTLTQPDALFQKMMSTSAGGIVEKAYSEQHPNFGTPKTPPMCTGPYKFGSWKSGSQIVIERNDHYWGGTEPKVARITFSILQGDATQTKALTGDAIDGTYQPPFTALGQLEKHGHVYYGKSLLTFYLIPTRKPGPLQDPRIRKALFLALNRDAVAQTAFAGAAQASRSMVAQSAYGDVTPTRSKTTGGTDGDLAEAKKLVQEAGSPKAVIKLAGNPGITDSLTQTLQALAEAGQKIGLNTVYKSVTMGQFYGLFGSPNGWKAVDADGFGAQYNFPVADPQSQYRIWANPKDYENYGAFNDPESSKLIDQASATIDPSQRDDLLARADARLFDQMPWIPVVDVASTLYLNKDVTGPPASFVYWWYPWAADLGGSSAG